MTKYMISWDDDTVFIEAPRSPEIMELVKKVFEVGMNPTETKKVKTRKRLQEKQLLNQISNVLDAQLLPRENLNLSCEDKIVADFYEMFPDVEVNDHRLRRHIRKIIKGGVDKR